MQCFVDNAGHIDLSRNLGLLTNSQQDQLLQAHALVCGLGGMGGIAAEALVRMGLGSLTICEHDVFESHNINRQIHCTMHTIGRPKVEVVRDHLLSINPRLRLSCFGHVGVDNIGKLLQGCDLIINGMDDIRASIVLEREARRIGKTIIDAWITPYASVFVMTADAPHWEEFLDFPTKGKPIDKITENDVTESMRREVAFTLKQFTPFQILSPDLVENIILKKSARPSLVPCVWISGVLMANEALKLLTGQGQIATHWGVFYNQYDHAIRVFNSAGASASSICPIDKLEATIGPFEFRCIWNPARTLNLPDLQKLSKTANWINRQRQPVSYGFFDESKGIQFRERFLQDSAWCLIYKGNIPCGFVYTYDMGELNHKRVIHWELIKWTRSATREYFAAPHTLLSLGHLCNSGPHYITSISHLPLIIHLVQITCSHVYPRSDGISSRPLEYLQIRDLMNERYILPVLGSKAVIHDDSFVMFGNGSTDDLGFERRWKLVSKSKNPELDVFVERQLVRQVADGELRVAHDQVQVGVVDFHLLGRSPCAELMNRAKLRLGVCDLPEIG